MTQTFARSPGLQVAVTAARLRGTLGVLSERNPELVAEVERIQRARAATIPSESLREQALRVIGLASIAGEPEAVDPPTVTPPVEVASPVVPEAAASAPVSVERTPEQWRAIVDAAPEANVIAWLAERGIPRIDFYRARKALRG